LFLLTDEVFLYQFPLKALVLFKLITFELRLERQGFKSNFLLGDSGLLFYDQGIFLGQGHIGVGFDQRVLFGEFVVFLQDLLLDFLNFSVIFRQDTLDQDVAGLFVGCKLNGEFVGQILHLDCLLVLLLVKFALLVHAINLGVSPLVLAEVGLHVFEQLTLLEQNICDLHSLHPDTEALALLLHVVLDSVADFVTGIQDLADAG